MQTPLAEALHHVLLPKLVEVGWGSGGDDDAALSEYIILMLVNGKTQDQIAVELAGDLLNLGPDDPGARDFSRWLFEQVEAINQQQNSGSSIQQTLIGNDSTQDAEMADISEVSDVTVPTGPKSMRNGPSSTNRSRDKRMLGHLSKAMDRSHDEVLHRVRPHSGTERINSHSRVPPTGPRGSLARGGAVRPQVGRAIAPPARANFPGAVPGQQEMQFLQMLEQQAAMMMQQFVSANAANGMNGMNGFNGNISFSQKQAPGRPIHERVQPNPRGQQNGGFRKQPIQNSGRVQEPVKQESKMDLDMPLSDHHPLGPDTVCKFNLSCVNKDCKFAHQSPAAHPGAPIDVKDVCSYGAACKNKKCVARHPSPAQKIAHQVDQDCKYWPNCSNQRCPFRHGTICRNGADCSTPDCKFTHIKIQCKFNPCLNPSCAFKHVEGQKRGKFEDKVWVAGGSKEHVSERKFVDDDGNEELVRAGQDDADTSQAGSINSEALIT